MLWRQNTRGCINIHILNQIHWWWMVFTYWIICSVFMDFSFQVRNPIQNSFKKVVPRTKKVWENLLYTVPPAPKPEDWSSHFAHCLPNVTSSHTDISNTATGVRLLYPLVVKSKFYIRADTKLRYHCVRQGHIHLLTKLCPLLEFDYPAQNSLASTAACG